METTEERTEQTTQSIYNKKVPKTRWKKLGLTAGLAAVLAFSSYTLYNPIYDIAQKINRRDESRKEAEFGKEWERLRDHRLWWKYNGRYITKDSLKELADGAGSDVKELERYINTP